MLTLKALEGGSRSSEATMVYHLLLSSVKTISVFEKQLTTGTRRKLQKANKLVCSLRKRAGLLTVHVQNHMPTTVADCAKFLSHLNSLCRH